MSDDIEDIQFTWWSGRGRNGPFFFLDISNGPFFNEIFIVFLLFLVFFFISNSYLFAVAHHDEPVMERR